MRRHLRLKLQMVIRKALNISSFFFEGEKSEESYGKRFVHTHATHLQGGRRAVQRINLDNNLLCSCSVSGVATKTTDFCVHVFHFVSVPNSLFFVAPGGGRYKSGETKTSIKSRGWGSLTDMFIMRCCSQTWKFRRRGFIKFSRRKLSPRSEHHNKFDGGLLCPQRGNVWNWRWFMSHHAWKQTNKNSLQP